MSALLHPSVFNIDYITRNMCCMLILVYDITFCLFDNKLTNITGKKNWQQKLIFYYTLYNTFCNSIFHFIFLHTDGSNNPIGLNSNSDRISFHQYVKIKDLTLQSLSQHKLPSLNCCADQDRKWYAGETRSSVPSCRRCPTFLSTAHSLVHDQLSPQ